MEHIKLDFIIFGAVDLKIWINYHLNKFLENIYKTKPIQNAKCTQTPFPRGADRRDPRVSRSHPSDTQSIRGRGPARISPLVRFPATPRAPTASRARDEPSHTHCSVYRAPELARRRAWRMRRHCSPWSGHLGAVEREPRIAKGVRSQGGSNALEIVGDGSEEGENHVTREVAGAPAHSGEL